MMRRSMFRETVNEKEVFGGERGKPRKEGGKDLGVAHQGFSVWTARVY